MCRRAVPLDPVVVLIDDESSGLSDEEIAAETAELLAALAVRSTLDLAGVDIAEIIRTDRQDGRT